MGVVHEVTLAPNFYRLLTNRYPASPFLFLNQSIFQSALRDLLKQISPDVLVYSSSHHWTGYPPLKTDLPIVFDYVDYSPPHVEGAYVQAANAVVTVTQQLASGVSRYGKPTTVIPNGVDLKRYTAVNREEAKTRLRLEGCRVVSLIGLTSSPRLYFVDAVAKLQQDIPNLLLLIVGGGRRLVEIGARIKQAGIKHSRVLGPIPNSEVRWYFCATDVGLYPAEDDPYFRQASPLKLVEYTAAGAQVVSSPVDAFRGWPNVHSVDASANSFASAIRAALEEPCDLPNVESYDWNGLAASFEDVLRRARFDGSD